MNILDSIRHEGLREDVPEFRVGDILHPDTWLGMSLYQCFHIVT